MKKKQVSIKSIATALNISVTTVSFVLNGKAEEKHISKEMTQKVLDYVKKTNYRPNQIAQSLRTGKSKILVFMVEDISNNFFSKLARIIEDMAYEKGYKVIFCSNENDDNKSEELIQLFNFRMVDGFIIVPSPGMQGVIKQLIDENIPVVLLDRYFSDLDSNIVIVNNDEAAYNATEHLIKNQYRKIGFITTDTSQTQMLDRLNGYKRAISDNGLVSNILYIPYNETSTQLSRDLIYSFVADNPELDSLFFSTNYLALRGLESLKSDCDALKKNFGVVTFDDNEFFSICNPTITAVAQPLYQIGEELMKIMLNLLKKIDDKPQKIILNTELKIRESSKPKQVF
ncbi:LacI family DNA-binding transcriptional regulator [Flavobacterium alkalisoli]|uniref:LacI family DNA-binding transcriptional regulator n=1 Tax=Flavobacterium alkalisoli TaxID=2602769 RepID=UPI003A94DA5A